MPTDHYLNTLFNPQNIAVIGASERVGSVSHKVMNNLLASQFAGELFPVNPKHTTVLGKTCYASVNAIPGAVDLAVITTPALTVPSIMKECGEKGIRTAIIISAGFSEMGDEGKALEQSILAIAKQYNIRFVGPNCLGLMRPQSHMNATFDNNNAAPGHIALLSQSGAICAAILDWAVDMNIGFSAIVSMGNSVDLDFGDLLEYLAQDPCTSSILLYIEGIHYPERFITGLRAAARVKPVIAIKAGRNGSGVRAVHSHTGALVGDDDVFSAVLARGGAVRVNSIEELFTAAQVLSSPYRAKGNRLTIVTNGGGAGVMAADAATDWRITLPALSEKTLTELNKLLPAEWSHQNPIDIIGDATPERYRNVVETCLRDESNDALLTILVPVSMSQPDKVAQEICQFAKKTDKPIITCWMGEHQVKKARKQFEENNIPCYNTPEVAVSAFAYLADYYTNQQLLLQEPQTSAATPTFDMADVQQIMAIAAAEKRTLLTTIESKAILNAFNIAVSQVMEASTADEAAKFAESLGFPVVMKISSPDITHKQDVGGVQLNVHNADAVRIAFKQIVDRVKLNKPTATISGVTVESMLSNLNYRELMIGIVRDKVFGPVISFGLGGSLVEVIHDHAIALPPLNAFLVKQMIAKTKAMKLLGDFRGKPAVNMDALVNVLLRVSDMIVALPQIQEMDINPLLIDEAGALAVDARFVIA